MLGGFALSIELHCPHCNKLIRAPDEAGGKRGKCPYCKQSAYIPLPATDDNVIPLAPVDKEDERRAEELRRESVRYAASMSRAAKSRPGSDEPAASAEGGARSQPPPGDVIDLAAQVERFVLSMRDSKLDEAEKIVDLLKHAGARPRDYIEGLMLDEMPPQFEGIPTPLLKGFLRKLLERLG